MERKSSDFGKIARTFYALLIILIVGSIIVVWARASLVGILVAIFMASMFIATAWVTFRKRAGQSRKADNHRSEESKQEVDRWQEQAMAEVRVHVANLQEIWLERIEQDKGRFLSRLREQATTQVVRLGGKVLRDLADENLEKHVINAFLRELEGEKGRLLFRGIDKPFLVRYGFRIDDTLSEALSLLLAQLFPPDRSVSFEVSKGLGIGIQIIAGDRRVDWNLDDYLGDLEKEVMAELQSGSQGARHE